ncbi:MAG: cytidylate kinase-like family protein [Lachnospiraceae bacterium]|nr:cytidylate kinase-like family protein [Lachnospiraceae bacterium]
MANKIITIGRQFGSNGREIGRELATKLDIPFYDKELLNETAKNSGMSEVVLKTLDERPSRSFLYSIVMDPYSFGFNSGGYQTDLSQKAFQATFDTVNKIGEEGPCVIVGRCADYALRKNPNKVSLFIHAPLEKRIETVMERFNLTYDKAKSQINKEDKARASYYNFYTSKKWGALESYDVFINSSLMSIEDNVDFIIEYMKKMR